MQVSEGEGPIISSPTRPPRRTAHDAKGVCNCPCGGTRRCTNEAVRATRPRATRPSKSDDHSWSAGPAACHRSRAGGNYERLGALVPGSLQTRGSRLARMIRYAANLSPPATAWPRRTPRTVLYGHSGATRPSTPREVLHGHSGPPGPALHGHSGGGGGWAGSSSAPDPGERWSRSGRGFTSEL